MAPHCWIGVHVYRDVMKCIYIFAITHYLCHNIVAQQVVIHLRQSCTCSAADPPLLICRLPGNEVCYGSKCTMNDNQEGGGLEKCVWQYVTQSFPWLRLRGRSRKPSSALP